MQLWSSSGGPFITRHVVSIPGILKCGARVFGLMHARSRLFRRHG
jgi:hypothetical protein